VVAHTFAAFATFPGHTSFHFTNQFPLVVRVIPEHFLQFNDVREKSASSMKDKGEGIGVVS